MKSVGYVPKYGFNSQKLGYTPGSQFKRFYGSNALRMNRRFVENQRTQMAMLGAAMFNQEYERSLGLSELAAQKLVKRVQDAAADISKSLDSLKTSARTNILV